MMNIANYKKQIIVATAELAVVVLFGVMFNWAHIKNDVTEKNVQVIYNNYSLLPGGESIKVRPGKHTISLKGPHIKTQTKSIFVLPFITSAINTPEKETDSGILSKVQNANVAAGDIALIKFFDDTWLFATIKTAGVNLDIAANYTDGQWQRIYTSELGIIDDYDIAIIPTDLLQLITNSIDSSEAFVSGEGD